MKYIESISILLFLIICSVSDVKKKKIYLNCCLVFFSLGIVLNILFDSHWKIKVIFGLIPGILMYVFSIITKGGIGKGDAFVFLCIGVTLGGIKCFEIFMLGLFFTVLLMVPYVLVKGKSLKLKVPFIPFVLLSFLTISLMGNLM